MAGKGVADPITAKTQDSNSGPGHGKHASEHPFWTKSNSVGHPCPRIRAVQCIDFVAVSAQFNAYIGARTDATGSSVLHTDWLEGRDSAKGLSGGPWHEDRLSPWHVGR